MYQKDDMYKELIEAHEGLSKEQSHELNAKLILLLLNEINDKSVWKNALTSARNDSV